MRGFSAFVASLLRSALGWQRRRDENDAALDDEIRGHFALAVADRIARGESADEALAAARREFGNIGHVKEVTRETWGGLWLERLLQDLRYAIRSLRRAPGFALVAVLTLALGIGVDTAMFTLVNGVLLRPLPFPDPDRLFVASYTPPRGPFNSFPGLYDIHYLALEKDDPVFARIATYSVDGATLSGAGDPVTLAAGKVTADFFGVLGVHPAFGRAFTAADAPATGEGSVAVLSDRLWRSHFRADSSVIGRSLMLDGRPRTIVGVMPAGFAYPSNAELWLPTTITTSPHQIRLRVVIGRLKPGLTPDVARAAFSAVASRFGAPGMRRTDFSPELISLKDLVVGDARRPLLVFAGAVVFVLLIACANVANLLLMRVATRDREMAVRAALGAGRARLIRQVMTETFTVSLVGAVVGVALAAAGARAVVAFAPAEAIPRAENVHLDATVLIFTIGLSIVTTVICGLVPALHATEERLRASLADGGARAGTGSHGRLRSLLVVTEIALALVLFTGAGLMLRSFHRMRSVDLGFHPGNLLTATVDLPGRKYASADAMRAYHETVLDGLRRIPGVDAAAAVNFLPLGGNLIAGDFHIEGAHDLPPNYMVDKMAVSPDYFRAMGVRIVRGRAFTTDDRADAPKVVIISRSIADRFWPNGGAIGKRITQADHPGPNDWLTIVGVVNDVVQTGVTSKPDAALYQAIAQTPQPFFLSHVTFVVHEANESPHIAAAMRQVVRRADPTLPLGSIAALGEIIDQTIVAPRFQSGMLLVFALLALTLAMIGIYGVLAYGVTQRMHEIGVRMALGATARDVVRMLLRQAVGLTVPGLLIGLAAAFALTRVLARFLFQITPTDPATFVVVCALLALVAVMAAIAPARRAVRVDPLVALRQE